MRIATLTLTILCLALAVPAFANTTFINSGPLDGNDNALFVTGPQFPTFFLVTSKTFRTGLFRKVPVRSRAARLVFGHSTTPTTAPTQPGST